MSRTIAVHVRYNSLYISLPSSAKQQREMTKFCVVWRTWTTMANILKFYFKFIAVSQIQFRESFDSDKQTKWVKSIPRFVGKNINSFFDRRCLRRRRSSFLNSLILGYAASQNLYKPQSEHKLWEAKYILYGVHLPFSIIFFSYFENFKRKTNVYQFSK